MLVGMLAGLVTGLVPPNGGIPARLAGILTQLALYSINLRIMGWGTTAGTQSTLAVSVDKFDLLVSSRYVRELSLRNPILLLLVIAAVVVGLLYWFFGTEIGCGIRATGANRNMARAQGINTEKNAVIGLMISNGIVALAGALIAQYQGSSTVDMGRGAIVIGLAAVIIGEVILGHRARNFATKLASCILGAILYYVVIQVVLRLGLNTNDLKLLTALIVALFLAIPHWKDKLMSGRRAVAGKGNNNA